MQLISTPKDSICGKDSPSEELHGADISNDTSKYQGFFTKEQAKERLGEKFDENYKKIASAVDEVLPYIITYDDTPIIAAFHSMSSGFTESAENAWGSPVDYLVEVDSRSDLTAPKFREDKRFTVDEMRAALAAAFPDASLGDDTAEWLVPQTLSDAGTVLTASVGDKTVTGGDIRAALDLRSAAFEVRCECGELHYLRILTVFVQNAIIFFHLLPNPSNNIDIAILICYNNFVPLFAV